MIVNSGSDRFQASAVFGLICVFAMGLSGPAAGQFEFKDNGAQLALFRKSVPVLVYNYGKSLANADSGDDGWVRSSSYIHPLFGLDGIPLTSNWPKDRLNERGVFWSWPRIRTVDSQFNLWRGEGLRQVFERWRLVQAGQTEAVIAFDNALTISGSDRAVAMETVEIRAAQASFRESIVDISVKLTNVQDTPIELLPQDDTDECIFAFRHDDSRKPFSFTNEKGPFDPDGLRTTSRWTDISARLPRRSQYSGVSIFQHPLNPGGEAARWVTRPDGLVGAQFQVKAPIVLAPGEYIKYRFRIYIHSGFGRDAKIQQAYDSYIRGLNLGANDD